MRVLMLGWEFPPALSGGLGTACCGLTRALARAGVDITFVLPRPRPSDSTAHVDLVGLERAEDAKIAPGGPHAEASSSRPLYELLFPQPDRSRMEFVEVEADIRPYDRPAGAEAQPAADPVRRVAGPAGPVPPAADADPGRIQSCDDLFREVERYAHRAAQAVAGKSFDVIHAHDWMTFPAAMAIAEASGKPFIAHIHSTEFDRSGYHIEQRIYDTERAGMHRADAVVAVSYLTRRIVLSRYDVPEEKITVVYNAVEAEGSGRSDGSPPPSIMRDEKIVLFLGRITMQKGPEYFLAAVRKVLQVLGKVRFVMAGSGDAVRKTMSLATELGIDDKVLFTGFLQGPDVERVFRCADLYVMPSVSDPFGIATLEAVSYDVPVLVSRQSGVAEVLQHVLKVDFWDIEEMANKIVAVLRHPPLHATLKTQAGYELRRLSWGDAAARCQEVYSALAAKTDVEKLPAVR